MNVPGTRRRIAKRICALGALLVVAIPWGPLGCAALPHLEATPISLRRTSPPGAPTLRHVVLTPSEDDRDEFVALQGRNRTSPFEGLVYDEERDRFVQPGRFSFDRDGGVTLSPEPLSGPAGATPRPLRELRRALELCESNRDCSPRGARTRIFAVWYGTAAITVLYGTNEPNAQAGQYYLPDSLQLTTLDPSTLQRLGDNGWESPITRLAPGAADAALERFVMDGTLEVTAALRRAPQRFRRGHAVALGAGPLGRVRVAPGSHTARVIARGRHATLLSELRLTPSASTRALTRRLRAEDLQARPSDDGVVTLESHPGGSRIASRNAALRPRWHHVLPAPVLDWTVDNSGWVYVATRSDGTVRMLALSPSGALVDDIVLPAATPPRTGALLFAAGDVCFHAPLDPNGAPATLTCVARSTRPQHGRPRRGPASQSGRRSDGAVSIESKTGRSHPPEGTPPEAASGAAAGQPKASSHASISA